MSPMSLFQNFFDIQIRRGGFLPCVLVMSFAIAGAGWQAQELAAQARWSPVGPEGGDARAFASVPGHPNHLFLGTTNSWIFESMDEGASWNRLAKLDNSDGLILDHIIVDPAHPNIMLVAAWKADRPEGGLWVSRDAGKNWIVSQGLQGQSIRAFIEAPSDPKMFFAGTLDGVFRSTDAGGTWTLISPPGSHEIHEVESVAVDPADPNILYAGTWHLPWKTNDGGKNWHSIKKGMIDDSDVFSIIIDPAKRDTVFLSACSGIYKSDSAGELFEKIKGIPSTARRTRVLMQDPVNHDVVYAGTTEGLYKTVDGGKTFKLMTEPNVIVNDVYVDPKDPKRVLLATDRGGVMASNDAGTTFTASNAGFSARMVSALLVDRNNPALLFAGVLNDKTYGGVFVSSDGGASWKQIEKGLEGRDVFALAQAQDGTLLAGTNHGIFALEEKGSAASWEPRNKIVNPAVKKVPDSAHSKRVSLEKPVREAPKELEGRVSALDLSGDVWLASTGVGVLTSKDHGASWQGATSVSSGEYLSVTAQGSMMAAARGDGMVFSTDAGQSWKPVQVPASITRIHRVAFSPKGILWMATREGIYFSRDNAMTWKWFDRLPLRNVDDLSYDARNDRMLASSRDSVQIYAIMPETLGWRWWRTDHRIGLIREAGDRLLAASLYEGVLIGEKPGWVVSGKRWGQGE
jgi:photosystem II stability/assembly factor-like uncharacterized protein